MRLVCPNCAAEYEVDSSLIPHEGREVQCANCAHTWFQKHVSDRPPAVLATPVVAPAAPAPDPEPEPEPEPAPAPALDPEEEARANIRSIAEEERAMRAHDRAPTELGAVPVPPPPRPEERRPPEEDHELLSNLRQHLAAIDDDFEDGKGGRAHKRSIVDAAANAGISDIATSDGQEEKRSSPYSDLAASLAALEEVEEEILREERGPRRWSRFGFFFAVILAAMAAGAYVARAEIAEAYPPAEPYLSQYAAMVDDLRLQVEGLYAGASSFVEDQIANLSSGE